MKKITRPLCLIIIPILTIAIIFPAYCAIGVSNVSCSAGSTNGDDISKGTNYTVSFDWTKDTWQTFYYAICLSTTTTHHFTSGSGSSDYWLTDSDGTGASCAYSNGCTGSDNSYSLVLPAYGTGWGDASTSGTGETVTINVPVGVSNGNYYIIIVVGQNDLQITEDGNIFGAESATSNYFNVAESNTIPTGGNDTKTFLEDNTATTFQTSDFTYSDSDSDPFDGIFIKSLETAGDLEYSGTDVVDETYYETMTNLIFKPAADANGSSYATFTHQVFDGKDYSTAGPYTMTINITAVNDEPSFTRGADQNADENCGAKSVTTWATSLDKGATNESSQTLTFTVTNDNNSLFSSQPAVSSTGTLTYTPATDATGTTVCTIYLRDNGGTANSGDDQSPDLTFNITVSEVEDLANWNSSMRIYINTTVDGANISGNVLDFPLLVRLDPSNFDFFSDVADDGADIRFGKSDNETFLPYEIEHWVDGASDKDTAVIWVKVDVVYGNTSDQYIKMFWNKSSETTTSNPSNVFQDSKNFKAVWHLDSSETGTGTVDVYRDATSNNNDGDDYVSATVKEGVAKYGQEFDGSDDYVSIPQSTSLDITGDATISGWLKLDANFTSASATSQIVLEKYGSATNNMHIGFVGTDYDYPQLSDGALVFKIEDTDNFRFIQTDITNWTADTWYHFAIQIDQDSPGSDKIFINGVDRTD